MNQGYYCIVFYILAENLYENIEKILDRFDKYKPISGVNPGSVIFQKRIRTHYAFHVQLIGTEFLWWILNIPPHTLHLDCSGWKIRQSIFLVWTNEIWDSHW